VDVLLVAPLVLSPRRRRRQHQHQHQQAGLPVASAGSFAADRGSLTSITTARPALRGKQRERFWDRAGERDRGSSRERSGSPSAAPRASSPTLGARRHRASSEAGATLWFEQGFLRGTVTSTHRDGSYDVAYWPTKAATRGPSSSSGLQYVPVLSTQSAILHGKAAEEGYLEVGVPPRFVRRLEGESVLTQHAADSNGASGPKPEPLIHLCLSAEQLGATRRPWSLARGSKGAKEDEERQSDDDDEGQGQEGGAEEEEVDLCPELGDEDYCPSSCVEEQAYFPLI